MLTLGGLREGMAVQFTMDTYKDIAHGPRDRRIHAITAFALWFAAGAYVTSTVLYYVSPVGGMAAELVGGAVVALAAAAI